MKKSRLLTLILAMLLVVCMLPASAFAGVGGTYDYTNDVTSYTDLKDYLGYDVINITGDVKTNNWAELAALVGSSEDGGKIPQIVVSSTSSEYPVKVLPKYDGEDFIQSSSVKQAIGHAISQDALFKGTEAFIYAKSTNTNKDLHNVEIDHQVVDSEGKLMLQYSESKYTTVTRSADNIIRVSVDPSNIGDASPNMYVLYNYPIWGWTSTSQGQGSPFNLARSYRYYLNTTYYSTVNTDVAVKILGNIKINKESKYGVALEGASFKLYTEVDCINEAKRFDVDTQTWVAVGEVTTGKDGSVTVTNLEPGTYYVKETVPPKGYVLNETPKAVTIAAAASLNLGLDTTSGEGTALANIDGATVKYDPTWNDFAVVNHEAVFLPLVKTSATTNENASTYGGTGAVFFKGKGKTVAFAVPADVAKLDAMTKLSTGKYDVNVFGKSAPNNSFDKLADALAYVNDTLITAGKIDDATLGQNHVSIKSNGTVLYYGDTKAAEVTITNEAIPVDVTVNKAWFNKTEPQPGEVVTVQLYQDGEKFGEAVKLESENQWTYTWRQLEGGHEYTVDEASMPDNSVLVGIKHEGNIWTITNKLVKDVQVTKSWFNDTPALRGETLEVQLYKDGKEYGDSVMLTVDNDWTYVWENVEAGGKYTVKEVKVPQGYKASYESKPGDTLDLLLIKNTYEEKSPETGDDTLLLVFGAVVTMIALVYVSMKLRKEN